MEIWKDRAGPYGQYPDVLQFDQLYSQTECASRALRFLIQTGLKSVAQWLAAWSSASSTADASIQQCPVCAEAGGGLLVCCGCGDAPGWTGAALGQGFNVLTGWEERA